jgi:polysaccharide export outer membrane protein
MTHAPLYNKVICRDAARLRAAGRLEGGVLTVDRGSIAVLAALTIVLAGVAAAQTKPQPPPPAPAPVEAPKTVPAVPGVAPAEGTGLPIDPKTYVIGPQDVIFIQVFHDTDFTRQAGVRPDGKITLPLIGDVQASGLTPERLAAQLKQAIGTYLTNPDVTVTVSQVNSKKYYISGEANRPGPFPLIVPTTVFEAINLAGGFRDFANQKNIVILKKDGTRLKFNYKEYVKGKKLDQNILMEDGDTIFIK